MQEGPRSTLTHGTFFPEDFVPSSADSKTASCQSIAKEWALNTGKLPQEACPGPVW